MKKELIDFFEVEELEQRLEYTWIPTTGQCLPTISVSGICGYME